MSARSEYAIVGGGPVGLGIAKCFTQAGLRFTLFEAEADFGGTWAISQASGLVYESTHLISSKKNTQFLDFPMPADYPHYPNHAQMLSYLRNLAAHYGLYDRAQFGARVASVEPNGAGCTVRLSSGESRTFSAVVIANGRMRTPLIPNYPGHFDGEIVHAADYRSRDIFRRKRVLVIGGGNSGCDIAVDASQTAERTFHSTRRGYHYMPKFIHGKPTQEWLMDIGSRFSSTDEYWTFVQREFKAAGYDPVDYGLPRPDHAIHQAHPILNSLLLYYVGHGDIRPKPDVRLFDGRTVEFADGTREEIDLILYATGYEMNFPFLSPEIRPRDGALELFLSMFHRKVDSLVFVGYFNAASGLGNLLNVGGALVTDYVMAREKNTDAFRVLRRLVRGPEPDIGRGQFLNTPRHRVETDLWKAIKVIQFFRSVLNPTATTVTESLR
ncbi:NAD(P)-binding domain-containing protein [Pendulispora brunnea]|uniref:NAD(P)-binding domain-containing protein n=1 Tax=Pendulispora brunnea TaxID=2905690 RepID=A0ABZ2KNH9_9BACT